MTLTFCGLFDDRLPELHNILLSIISHVRPEHHVLIEITGVQEGCRQPLLSDVVVDLIFTF